MRHMRGLWSLLVVCIGCTVIALHALIDGQCHWHPLASAWVAGFSLVALIFSVAVRRP